MPTQWPELPPSLGIKQKYYHKILYEYVLGRTYKHGSIGWVMVGLLQTLVPIFDQRFKSRTIEMPMDWPELPPSLGIKH